MLDTVQNSSLFADQAVLEKKKKRRALILFRPRVNVTRARLARYPYILVQERQERYGKNGIFKCNLLGSENCALVFCKAPYPLK